MADGDGILASDGSVGMLSDGSAALGIPAGGGACPCCPGGPGGGGGDTFACWSNGCADQPQPDPIVLTIAGATVITSYTDGGGCVTTWSPGGFGFNGSFTLPRLTAFDEVRVSECFLHGDCVYGAEFPAGTMTIKSGCDAEDTSDVVMSIQAVFSDGTLCFSASLVAIKFDTSTYLSRIEWARLLVNMTSPELHDCAFDPADNEDDNASAFYGVGANGGTVTISW